VGLLFKQQVKTLYTCPETFSFRDMCHQHIRYKTYQQCYLSQW